MNDFLAISTHSPVLPFSQTGLFYLREWRHHHPFRQRPKSHLWHFLLPQVRSNLLPNPFHSIPKYSSTQSVVFCLSHHFSPEAIITSCLKHCSSFLISLLYQLLSCLISSSHYRRHKPDRRQETPQTHAYVLSLAPTHLYDKDKLTAHGRPCVVWPWPSLLLHTCLASFCSLNPGYSALLLLLPVTLPLPSQGLCSNCPTSLP